MSSESTNKNIDLAFTVIDDALAGEERAAQIVSLAAGRPLVLIPRDRDQAAANVRLARRSREQGRDVTEIEIDRHVTFSRPRRGRR